MLSLTLELTSTPAATVTLTNTGPDAVVVNRRLTLNHPAQIEECREVHLHILDASQNEVLFSAFVRVPELTNQDFAPLAPGESVKQTYNLADYYTLARPGSYTIQAFYENTFSPSTGEAWQGKLESNRVTCQLS